MIFLARVPERWYCASFGLGRGCYQSARNASNGEIELARNAGIRAAISAEAPRTKIAKAIIVGSY